MTLEGRVWRYRHGSAFIMSFIYHVGAERGKRSDAANLTVSRVSFPIRRCNMTETDQGQPVPQ